MIILIHCIFLLCVLASGTGNKVRGKQHPLHPYLTQPTNIPCETTLDCLDHYAHAWCKSGTTCVNNQCHTIPSYPCERGEMCVESGHQCIKKKCSSWKDCDDGIFCNGVEKCVASVCVIDHRYDCTHGHCSEKTRSCITPHSLQQISQKAIIHAMDVPTAAPTASNSTGLNGDQTIYITVIVVASLIFAAGVVVFLLSSRKGGSGTEPYLFVIDRNTGGGEGDEDEDPTTTYTHQLHYQ